MPISLEGKTAIVTCATQGIGREIAQKLLDAGARVMLADGNEKALVKAEDDLRGDEDRIGRFQCRCHISVIKTPLLRKPVTHPVPIGCRNRDAVCQSLQHREWHAFVSGGQQ